MKFSNVTFNFLVVLFIYNHTYTWVFEYITKPFIVLFHEHVSSQNNSQFIFKNAYKYFQLIQTKL